MRKKTTTMKKASESRRSSRSKRAKPKAGRRTEKAAPAKRGATKRTTQDVPQFFRLNIEVGNLDTAAGFYAKLLGLAGRKQAGSRVYFTCGPVTLQVVDVSSESDPHPAAKALYFTVRDLDALYERARALGCLSKETVHGRPGGGITVRPWGERSFYAEDPWRNPLCFVEAGTIYPG